MTREAEPEAVGSSGEERVQQTMSEIGQEETF
jgi:hypothetical protein